jgi:hypothetical protein
VIDCNKGIEKSNSKLQITTVADKLTATWNELNSRVLKGIGLVAGLEIGYSTGSTGVSVIIANFHLQDRRFSHGQSFNSFLESPRIVSITIKTSPIGIPTFGS